jgi:hypothetical protein
MRALVVCLSFALACAPPAQQGELTWPARAVATLVAAAVCRAPTAQAYESAVERARAGQRAHACGRAPSLLPSLAAPSAVSARRRERAPALDGRHLYLEQRTLLC